MTLSIMEGPYYVESFMLTVTYAECHYAECRYTECRGTERRPVYFQ